MSDPGTPLRVLVVDDSAVVRQVLAAILGQGGRMVVATADSAAAASECLRQDVYDVLVLDIEMPRVDGLTFLRALMRERPMPVVVCSGHVREHSTLALEALALGAVEVLAKPRLGSRAENRDLVTQLADTVRAAARARVRGGAVRSAAPHRAPGAAGRTVAITPRARVSVVAIGASTGGTDAIRQLLHALPPDAPPIAIVQHMPEGFTAAFARDLDRNSRITVREATHEEPLRRGLALIAPGNRHLMIARRGADLVAELHTGPLVSRHRPSVDVLFGSVSRLGTTSMGVLLTGMGDDGAEGLRAMREAGALTLAQDEASCVVFGMPAAAITRGAVMHVMPLRDIAAAIQQADTRA